MEDEKSGWGEQVRKDWRELKVEDVDHWMKLVEDRGWIRNKLKQPSTADAAEAADADDDAGQQQD